MKRIMQKFVVVKKSQNTNNKLEQPAPSIHHLPVINSHSTNTSNNTNTQITTTPSSKIRSSLGLQQKSIAPSTEMTPSHVKMSGYLKKKRNKMTGWRKLWFVLQNQLLLSYSSKDDYEKKLAPFKDVLNLVPGTIIRPTKGPRFIIETSTNIIYTYRCDDIKTCSEWITALMESLGACTVQHNNNNILSQNLHYSLDNLTNNAIPKKIFQSSKSWDSVYRTKITKSPNLPIAKSTAKILKRNGLQQQSELSDGTTDIGYQERVQNFRLHQNNLKVNQSQDVSRINSMFINNNTSNHTNNNGCDTNNNLNLLIKCNKRILIEHNLNRNNLSGNIKNRKNQIDTNNFQNKMNLNENDIDCENYSSIEEQIQRMSLGEEQTSCSTESENEHLISSSSSSSDHPSENINHQNHNNDNEPINDNCSSINEMQKLQDTITIMNDKEPIYAVVDLKNKYARRAKIKEMAIKMSHDKIPERPRSYHVSSNDYEEVLHFANCVDSKDDENENIYEPINIPELMPKSPLWKYFSKLNIEALVEITKRKKDTQTPINKPVPELTTFSDIRKRWGNHRKSIKNRMKRIYGKESKMDCNNYDECNMDECNINNTNNGNRNNNANEPINHNNAIVASSSSASSSTSSVNTNVNGNKLPIENKCTSASSASSSSATVSSASSTSTTSSMLKNEFEKYRRGEKHIFGSLGRLKKPRTSLCLDENALSPRKKLVISHSSNNSNNNNKVDVQQELKLDDKNSDHTDNKMKQCHSKFYD